MSEEILKTRYAKALFEVASEGGELEKVNKELIALQEILEKHPELIMIFNHPAIEMREKQALLGELFRNKSFSPVLKLFLEQVIKNGRLTLLEEIFKTYQEMLNSHQRRLGVEVDSAFPLLEEERLLLERRLSAKFNKKLELILKVDKALLGGIRIKVADTLYDGSLKGRLGVLKEALGE
jgi:F-type H+-transporting ATPase subunit delta